MLWTKYHLKKKKETGGYLDINNITISVIYNRQTTRGHNKSKTLCVFFGMCWLSSFFLIANRILLQNRVTRKFVIYDELQYIPRNMHTVFALLCFVVVIHWLIFPYPSGLLHWHCGNLTIAPVPAKQPWWLWINTSCEFIMNDCITTTKQSTTRPCANFLGYTVSITMTS